MVELLDDIDALTVALHLLDPECASDEKRQGRQIIEDLITKKEKVVADFEKEYAPS